MRRLARHLFTLCAAASLLLGAAACALWVRSHWRADVVHVRGDVWWAYLQAGGGRMRAGAWRVADHDPGPDRPGQRVMYGAHPYAEVAPVLASYESSAARRAHVAGFQYLDLRNQFPSYREAAIPLWSVVLVLSLQAAAALRHARRRRRRALLGLCRRCGYDLRATPGRCPECGAVSAPVEGTP